MPPRPGTQTSPSDLAAERALPHDLEAERSVLAAILLDESVCNTATELLKSEDFFRDSHRLIYERMVELSGSGQPIDTTTLANGLARRNQLELVGGVTFLSTLIDTYALPSNIEAYARIIKDCAMLRRAIQVCQDGMAACFEQGDEAETIIDNLEKAIFEVGEDRIRSGFVAVAEVARDQLAQVEDAQNRPDSLTGLWTGFTDLDRMTNGLQPSDLIIVAARPSMGKTAFCLNIAQNVAVAGGKTVGVYSLEMSKESLVLRMLCAEGMVDSQRMRGGFLGKEEWAKLAEALQALSSAKIFIDDTPGISVMEMRAKARRLKAQHGLDLLIVDYLQLIRGKGKIENRQTEVSQISRDLKALAKELSVPLIALSQLSRASESRSDHRPMLSDLRESGCLTGETLVTLADSGAQVPIADLVGKSNFAVWALNETTMRIERANVSRAFSTGIKPVFRLTTRLGRTIRATANHKFRGFDGWKRLDEFKPGERLAVPRVVPSSDVQTMTNTELALLGHLIGDGCTLPRHVIQYTTREKDLAETVAALAVEVFGDLISPRIQRERDWYQVYLTSTRHHTHGVRNAIAEWLSGLGAFGLRSHEKHIPDKVFEQPKEAIALFLRHLWATDGCISLVMKRSVNRPYPAVYYASSSERLIDGVLSLLLRLGINARKTRRPQKGKGRDQFHVTVTGRPDLDIFAETIRSVGEYKTAGLETVREYLATTTGKTNRDVIPFSVWDKIVRPTMREEEISNRNLTQRLNMAYCGHTLYGQNLSRERALRVAEAVGSDELAKLATSDVYWDEIVSIVPDGESEVFDLTVDIHHNFLACGLTVHNSIEQDADVVGFIFREEMYDQTDENDGKAELIIAKQRNGPTGTIELSFMKHCTRFNNAWRDV